MSSADHVAYDGSALHQSMMLGRIVFWVDIACNFQVFVDLCLTETMLWMLA